MKNSKNEKTTPQRVVIVVKGGRVTSAITSNPSLEVIIHNEDSLWFTGEGAAEALDAAARDCKPVATIPSFWIKGSNNSCSDGSKVSPETVAKV